LLSERLLRGAHVNANGSKSDSGKDQPAGREGGGPVER